MFIASVSHTRAVSVLLGGSGVSEQVPGAKSVVGALLSPRKPQTSQDVSGSIGFASVGALGQAHRHD